MTAPSSDWMPANDVERALAEAFATDARQEFFRLVATADLYLPAFTDTEAGAPQRLLTMTLLGQEYLPVFTSVAALILGVGDRVQAYTVTTYEELARKWPSPEWRLAINPGNPIDAYLPVEAVAEAARGDLLIPTSAELLLDARGEALARAAAEGDGEAYLTALLDSDVFLPAARPAELSQLIDGSFPWCPVVRPIPDPEPGGPTDALTIEVYPLPGPVPPGMEGVVLPVPELMAAWPEPGYQLAVIGTGGTVTVPGTALASLGLALLFEGDDTDDDDDEAGREAPRAIAAPSGADRHDRPADGGGRAVWSGGSWAPGSWGRDSWGS